MTTNQVQTQTQPARPNALGVLPVPFLTLGAVAVSPAGGKGGVTGEFGK